MKTGKRVPKRLIAEAAERGIIPGARCKDYCGDVWTLRPWTDYHMGPCGGIYSNEMHMVTGNGERYENLHEVYRHPHGWAKVVRKAPLKAEDPTS